MCLSSEVQDALKEMFGVDVEMAQTFHRMQVNGKVYHSREYKRMKTRNSCTICYSADGQEKYGLIEFFTCLPTCTVAVITQLETSSNYCYKPELTILCSRVIPVVSDNNIT